MKISFLQTLCGGFSFMDRNQTIETLKQYALKGISECNSHGGVAAIGTGVGVIIAGLAGWNFAACLCIGIVVIAAGCFVVFDKTNP